jgi:GNAT superfamily N-acetyltransferase
VSMEPIEIRLGLPEGYRHQAAEIYDHAFHLKLAPMLGPRERCIAVIEQVLDPSLAIAAFQGERLVGVAGLQYGGKSYVPARLGPFVRELGLLRGLLSGLIFALLFVSHRKVGLLIESLAVAPDMRGQGVGTQLLKAVFDFAAAQGFGSVWLEVVDTNPHAQRLYERMGFVARETKQYPYFYRRAGFSAVTVMSREI